MGRAETKRMRTTLRCNECQTQFEGPAVFVPIETSDLDIVDWVPARDGARGNTCPNCGSAAIGVLDD
jgi:hypothetical protein